MTSSVPVVLLVAAVAMYTPPFAIILAPSDLLATMPAWYRIRENGVSKTREDGRTARSVAPCTLDVVDSEAVPRSPSEARLGMRKA